MFDQAEFWKILTDIIAGLALLDFAVIALSSLYQWIKRKSFLKIDRELRWTLLPFSLMALTYVFFEKICIISYRPPASGLPWEPSFPSTHTMLVTTIFLVTIILLPKYVKSRAGYLNLDAAMLVAIALVAIGRVLANMHWPTDVLGGLLFGAAFTVIYDLILRRVPSKTPPSKNTSSKKRPTKPHQSFPESPSH